VPGLVTEAPSLGALVANLRLLIPERLELNESRNGTGYSRLGCPCSLIPATHDVSTYFALVEGYV
jgi:hypothetical protein